jgi:VWFA-related protein
MRTILRFLLTLGLISSWMLATPLTAFAQDDSSGLVVRITQVDNSAFPQVTVYVSVTNASGEPVSVNPSQIQLYENGQLMHAQASGIGGTGEVGPLTTMLILDVSGSMNEVGKLEAAKSAAQAYVDQMRAGDQAGLMTFNTVVKYVLPVTADKKALSEAIQGVQAYENTSMYDALSQAVDILQPISGRKAIIVMTDGMDNVSKANADSVVKAIGPGGLTISTIGLGDPDVQNSNAGLDEEGLRELAERAGGVYAYANDVASLTAVYQQFGRTLQSEYQLTYISPSTLRDGVNRNLTVSIAGQESVTDEAKYNPGGVLPEVTGNVSWPLFIVLLIFLVVLLIVPLFGGRIMQAVAGLVPGAPGATKPAKKNKAAGRIKLK